MAKQNINVLEIIQKIMADPRFINVVSEILDDISNNTPAVKAAPPAKTKKKKSPVDYTKKSDAALRTAHAYRKKHGLAIEPELNAELARRFPGYDVETKQFKGVQKSVRTTHQRKTNIDYTVKSDWALRALYSYRKKHGQDIEPELNEILAARFKGYDAAQQKFTGRGGKRKTKAKKERIINWSEKPDDILRNAFKHRKHTTGIDDALNAELARRFPNEYDPTTRTFIKQKKVHTFTTKDTKQSAMTATTNARHTTTTALRPATTDTAVPTLSVKLKLVKQSLQDAYYNVYVNGKLILRNHANTELQLFGEGTLLAVHGIVTDNKNLPRRPLYMIYDTNLVANKWAGRDKIAGYDIYAKSINPSPDGVNVTLSNRCTILLNNEKLKRLAGITRFEIKR